MASRYVTSSSTLTRPLCARIAEDAALGPSTFRMAYREPNAEAARTWLHDQAQVIDTTLLTHRQAALRIADAVNR